MFNFANQAVGKENFQPSNNVAINFDALQKARKDLIGEIEAIMEYDNHIHDTANALARKTWEHIKQDELHHVGELLGLLSYLDPSQVPEVVAGFEEFEKLKQNMNG